MISFSEILQKATYFEHTNTPFVLFKRPNEKRVFLMKQTENELYVFNNSFENEGFVLAPFQNTTHQSIFLKADETYFAESEEINLDFTKKNPFEIQQDDKQNHIDLVKKAVETMKRSDLYKVVLSRKIIVPYEGNPVHTFTKMIHRYPTAFCYLFFHPKVGMWLAATPEILLKFSENKLQTMALAGTQPFKEGTILWQQKERNEQQIVTDEIVKNLKKYTDNQKISEVETLKAGNVVHLCTHITADLQANRSAFEVVSELHPTPAVCGFPFEKAQRFILENEPYDRAYYTGYCGVVEQQKFDFYVNLRCMQIKDNQSFIYVGGGILRESVPELEWEETQNKAQTMFGILG